MVVLFYHFLWGIMNTSSVLIASAFSIFCLSMGISLFLTLNEVEIFTGYGSTVMICSSRIQGILRMLFSFRLTKLDLSDGWDPTETTRISLVRSLDNLWLFKGYLSTRFSPVCNCRRRIIYFSLTTRSKMLGFLSLVSFRRLCIVYQANLWCGFQICEPESDCGGFNDG